MLFFIIAIGLLVSSEYIIFDINYQLIKAYSPVYVVGVTVYRGLFDEKLRCDGTTLLCMGQQFNEDHPTCRLM